MNRRKAITRTGALLAGTCLAPIACSMSPISRRGKSPLKLSLAAYSMRKFLPDTRRNPKAASKMDMLGFIDYAATLGLDAVELTGYFMPHPLSDHDLHQLKLKAHLSGLDISGGAIGNNFTNPPSSAAGRQQLADVRYWIDRYATLGAPVIRVFGGKPDKGISESEAVRNIIANMKIACDYAGERGVILGMENHDFLIDIDRMLPIVKAVDSPWFGVNFDSGNIAPTDDPYRELERIAPYSVNAQVKVEIPVNGKKVHADLGRIVEILKNANYLGYVVLEYEGSEDPKEAIPGYLSQLRELIA